MKNKTTQILSALFGLITLLSAACSGSPADSSAAPIDSTHASSKNFVEATIDKLSPIGIGKLGSWKDNGMGGYMSITPYYQLGDESGEGMQNNIALYLESDKPDMIQKYTLALNINQPAEKKQAWAKMQEVTTTLFNNIDLKMPDGLQSALQSHKSFHGSAGQHKIDLKLEKTKIETWLLVIENSDQLTKK
jgi:hypothetical protein